MVRLFSSYPTNSACCYVRAVCFVTTCVLVVDVTAFLHSNRLTCLVLSFVLGHFGIIYYSMHRRALRFIHYYAVLLGGLYSLDALIQERNLRHHTVYIYQLTYMPVT